MHIALKQYPRVFPVSEPSRRDDVDAGPHDCLSREAVAASFVRREAFDAGSFDGLVPDGIERPVVRVAKYLERSAAIERPFRG